MSIQHLSISHHGQTRAPRAVAVGIGLLIIIGTVSGFTSLRDLAAPAAVQCQDKADVMASLDRSRNGVSLTCNDDILSKGKIS